MAAATTDKITDVRNGARPNSAKVTVIRSVAGASLACDSLTGWPTASKVHFVTYKVDTNGDPVTGSQLDCSGIVVANSITSFTVEDGSDSGHAVGDIVEMLPTAKWGQDLADALSTSLDRTGALKTVAVTKGGTGAVTLAANGVLVGNDTSAVTVVSPGTAGQVLTSNGSSSAPTYQPAGATTSMSLLKANSGSDTNASAANVDTYAMASGLTAKDTLLIYYDCESTTQDTGNPVFYSTTDSKILMETAGTTAVSADHFLSGFIRIRQSQAAATTYNSAIYDNNGTIAATGGTSTSAGRVRQTTSNTAWTGNWTIAFRHGGVTAGGTFHWSWAIYKVAGQ